MSDNKYYSEGKYRCNHPESDFEKTSTNPIEMKKENFVEYTHPIIGMMCGMEVKILHLHRILIQIIRIMTLQMDTKDMQK